MKKMTKFITLMLILTAAAITTAEPWFRLCLVLSAQ